MEYWDPPSPPPTVEGYTYRSMPRRAIRVSPERPVAYIGPHITVQRENIRQRYPQPQRYQVPHQQVPMDLDPQEQQQRPQHHQQQPRQVDRMPTD